MASVHRVRSLSMRAASLRGNMAGQRRAVQERSSRGGPSSKTAAFGKPRAAATTRVAIIGVGRGGTALLEIFAKDPLVQIVGIAEIDPKAEGLKLARRLSIPVSRNYQDLLAMDCVDLIIDVSGNPDVERALQAFYRMGVTVIGGASAKFMWQLIEARIRATGEIEKALNKYQSLYRLYVKESGAAVTEERTRIACEIHDGLV
ncbi:MAG TPA: Gfo/Idh/MocA family oxidoreductase, partial [Nitrospiraceae bacterium]|nr:Gfo/Idh/MocA family oxidoreductase [Nitrospiraceae bacterium]